MLAHLRVSKCLQSKLEGELASTEGAQGTQLGHGAMILLLLILHMLVNEIRCPLLQICNARIHPGRNLSSTAFQQLYTDEKYLIHAGIRYQKIAPACGCCAGMAQICEGARMRNYVTNVCQCLPVSTIDNSQARPFIAYLGDVVYMMTEGEGTAARAFSPDGPWSLLSPSFLGHLLICLPPHDHGRTCMAAVKEFSGSVCPHFLSFISPDSFVTHRVGLLGPHVIQARFRQLEERTECTPCRTTT